MSKRDRLRYTKNFKSTSYEALSIEDLDMNVNPEIVIEKEDDENEAPEAAMERDSNSEEAELQGLNNEEDENEDEDEDDEVFSNEVFPDRKESKGLEVTLDVVSDSSAVSTPDLIPKSLHQLARDGDVLVLQAITKDRRDEIAGRINSLDDKELTPLHYAARYSHLEMMEQLVDLGANVNKTGDDDMTPLHYAARYSKKASAHRVNAMRVQSMKRSSTISPVSPLSDDSRKVSLSTLDQSPTQSRRGSDAPDFIGGSQVADKMIKFLVEKGASVNAMDKYNLTALHHAAIRGHVAAVKSLLSIPGIDKEPRDVQDSTPLHIAATYNHPAVINLLLDEKANPRSMDSDSRTPLHEACREGNKDIADLLLRKGEEMFGVGYAKAMMKDLDEEGCSPLLLGVGSGQVDIVRLLLDKHANVNITNKDLIYPVHSASRIGDLETLKILVKHHAKLDVRNALLQTPLYLAASNKHPDVIKFLVQNGASLDLWDMDGLTPLSVAAREGNDECVSALILLGARLDIVDKDEKTCLFHAAEENHAHVVRTLLSHLRGRELLELNDQYDNLPIHIASAKGNVECVKLLLEYGADIDNKNEDEMTPLHLAAINGRIKVVEMILEQDRGAVMDEDEDSNTALHLACMHKRGKVAQLLLENGANVQSRNAKKWTPLDCAAASGAYKCAKLLLEAEAPIDPIDRSKTTPLHLAAENGHDKMILLLLDYGANIGSEDAYGRNMLELAILSRKRHVVKTVLQHENWRKAMRTTYSVADRHGTDVPETPLRLLIRIYPDLAEMVFDQCISVERPDEGQSMMPKSTLIWQSGAKVKFDYEFIDDAFNMKKEGDNEDNGKVKFRYCSADNNQTLKRFDEPYDGNGKVVMDNHPLMIMATQKQKNLLRHPLCLALVRHKWKSFGRYVYYSQLSLYLLFLFFLTSYVLISPNLDQVVSLELCGKNDTKTQQKIAYLRLLNEPSDPVKGAFEWVCQFGIFVLVGANIIVEFVQWYRAGRRYFQWTNFFDWVVYVLSFVLVYDVAEDSTNTGIRTCWQWELGAMVIVLAWLNLLGDIRQLPFLGIYVIMFFDILKTFLKFVLVFLVFIVAFGLGFHLLLITKEDSAFETYGYSLLKTAVMMLGEMEFDSLFFDGDLSFEVSTVILFIIFLVVMAIIIMNLLVGLAVDDIKAVQEQAVLQRLAMQVDLVLDVERLVPIFLLQRFNKQIEVIQRKSRSWWSIFTDVVSSKNIVRDATTFKETLALGDVVEKQDMLDDNMKQMRSDVKALMAENEKIKDMLLALVEKNDLSLSGDTLD